MQSRPQKLASRISHFFFDPASAAPLAALRISISAVLLAQVGFLYQDIFELFGSKAILQESLTSYFVSPMVPRLSWVLPILNSWGISEQTALIAVGVGYCLVLFSLLLGLASRFSAFSAWFLHWVLMNTGLCTNYGADNYAHVFLFYLIWMPCGRLWSLDALIKKPLVSSSWARLSLRVIQLHLCISYFMAGFDKAMGPQWWNGEVIWRALMLPVYSQWDMSWLAQVPVLAKVSAWGTLVVEMGYPIFIWPKRTRRLWIALIVSMHLGIIVFLGLGIFGAIMTCFTVCAFGVSAIPAAYRASSQAQHLQPKLEPNAAIS